VARLKADDDRHYDRVARQQVEVEKREREVAAVKANLTKLEANIRKMRDDLASGAEFVVYGGTKYTSAEVREQVRLDAQTFRAAEDNLKAKEEQLKAQKRALNADVKKLKALAQARQEMENELSRLQAALAEERLAQASSESQLDDGNYSRVRADIAAAREQLDVMRKTRELKGASTRGPIRAVEEAKKQDNQIDQYLDERFGKVKDEVSADKK
jgi:multidrug resistance efflux pump